MHSSAILLKQFWSTAAKSSGFSRSTLAWMLCIGDGFLAFNDSSWSKASKAVVFLKVNDLEGAHRYFLYLLNT